MASQGVLGKPYRIVYLAKNFVTGLEDLTCKIIKPDLTISEAYPLIEFEDADLKGCYYFDFLTTETDEIGDYIAVINNPEQALKEGYRITYQTATQSEALGSISEGLEKNYFAL